MEKDKIIVAIDIGTSKITTIVGDIDELGDLHIIGFGEAKSRGIDRGIITNSHDAVRAIKESVNLAETTSGYKIMDAVVNIGGANLEFQNDKEFLTFGVSQKEITYEDIESLHNKVISKAAKENYEIIHALAKRYILDDENDVIDPEGMFGSKLEAEFHIVFTKLTPFFNLKKVVETAGIHPIRFIANPIASSVSVLYTEEKDMGVVLLDIGAGTTDISIYVDGAIEFSKSLPVGGNQITMDIAHRFRISKDDAEALKKEHGAAIVEAIEQNETISIYPRGYDEPVEVEKIELVDTIEARLLDIFDLIKKELQTTNLLSRTTAGIVLTGGVANAPYMRTLAEEAFGLDVRLGKPKDYRGFSEKLAYPQYATSVGMLTMLKNDSNIIQSQELNGKSGFMDFWKKLTETVRNWFY